MTRPGMVKAPMMDRTQRGPARTTVTTRPTIVRLTVRPVAGRTVGDGEKPGPPGSGAWLAAYSSALAVVTASADGTGAAWGLGDRGAHHDRLPTVHTRP